MPVHRLYALEFEVEPAQVFGDIGQTFGAVGQIDDKDRQCH
jgi:hypothetical protein